MVRDNAGVCGDARVCDNEDVVCGIRMDDHMSTKISTSMYASPVGGVVRLYKRVRKVSDGRYRSLHDKGFLYTDGEVAEADRPDEDESVSCGRGLHVSHPHYWTNGDTLIACDIEVSDIIAIQEGKCRVRKLLVIGEVDQ